MLTWTTHRKRLISAGMISLTVLVLSFLLFARVTEAKPRPIFYLPPRDETIVYLAPRAGTAFGLPISVADLKPNGVTVVYDFSELEDLVAAGPSPVDAVIIHNARLNDVDQLWIRNLYRQSVVIAGVNVTIRDLGRLVDDDYVANDSTWTDGWQKDPFFSILAFTATGTSEEQQRASAEGRLLGVAARSTDNIRNPSDVDFFLSLIRRNIWELRELKTPAATN